MKKTMIYLEDDQFFLLKKVAASSKKRMSEIIREALSGYLKKKKERLDYFSLVGIAEGPVKGKTSEQAEKILREALK
ncbi:MAG TPA: DNA-binding protein [Syntrophaceae bacterium]|nr:DNA-binding protein [Syntrophaceae bacterium]